VRDVGEELLAHALQPFEPRDVEEDADRAAHVAAVDDLAPAERRDVQVVDAALVAAGGLDLDLGALPARDRAGERGVDGRVARQVAQAPRAQGVGAALPEGRARRVVERDDAHGVVDDDDGLAHAVHRHF
jgi:hypothetical protein